MGLSTHLIGKQKKETCLVPQRTENLDCTSGILTWENPGGLTMFQKIDLKQLVNGSCDYVLPEEWDWK